MEAYIDEVRKLEERFDGLQAEHVPRSENAIADDLSKRAALKLPVEPGIFVLRLTQPSVTPSTRSDKRRKLSTGKYFPVELPAGASGKSLAGNDELASERQLRAPAAKVCAPAAQMPVAGEQRPPAEL